MHVKRPICDGNGHLLFIALLIGFIAGFAAVFGSGKRLANSSQPTSGSPNREITLRDAATFDEARWKHASSQERVAWLFDICQRKDALARDHALWEALSRFEPGDFLAALANLPAFGETMAQLDPDVRTALAQAAIDRWLDVDETGALGWLSTATAVVESGKVQLPEIGRQDVQAMYELLAVRKPEWVLEQVPRLGKKTHREWAVWLLMLKAAESRPEKAREWLQTFDGTEDARVAKSGFVYGLADSDPVAAVTLAMQSNGPAQDEMLFGVFERTVSNRPGALADVLAKMNPPQRKVMTWIAVRGLGKNSAIDPFAWIQERIAADPTLVEVSASQAAFDAARNVSGLVAVDPLRTLEWVRSFPETQRAAYIDGTLSAWSRSDPRAMLKWLAIQPSDALPTNVPGLAACAIADPPAFAQWTQTLPSGELHDRAEVALAADYVSANRIADALRTLPVLPSSEVGVGATQKMVLTIAQRDPRATANWVMSVEDQRLQNAAAGALVTTWASQSLEDTATWVDRLPAGGLRESAVGALAGAVAQSDPVSATLWFAQITNPNARSAAAREVYSAWKFQDPVAARNWLTSVHGIDESLRARLLRQRR
jgi:hypothetical protein